MRKEGVRRAGSSRVNRTLTGILSFETSRDTSRAKKLVAIRSETRQAKPSRAESSRVERDKQRVHEIGRANRRNELYFLMTVPVGPAGSPR